MSLVLNTNIDSIIAQNNLTGSQSLLSQSLTRLSSGLRINSAADDAAGSRDQPAVHHADQRHQPGDQQRERRRVRSADRGRRAHHDRQQPAEHPHPRGRIGQRFEQRLGSRRARLRRCSSRSRKSPRSPRRRPSTARACSTAPAAPRPTRSVRTSATPSRSTWRRASAPTRSARRRPPPARRSAATHLTGSNLTIAVGTGTAVAIGASVTGTAAGQTASSAYAKVQAINAAGVAGLTASATTTVTGSGGVLEHRRLLGRDQHLCLDDQRRGDLRRRHHGRLRARR